MIGGKRDGPNLLPHYHSHVRKDSGREGWKKKKRLGDRERSITEANGDREERD